VLAAAVLILWHYPRGAHVLQPYQVKRITGFLHPDSTRQARRNNIAQSKVAVGAGGFDGAGVAGARRRLSYLPEHATDFVLHRSPSSAAFFGTAVLLLLYLLVVWVAYECHRPRDLFSAIVAGSWSLVVRPDLCDVGMTMGNSADHRHIRSRSSAVGGSR